jgi:methionyl-tRNA formyltransferase
MGTAGFGIPSLGILRENGYPIVGVVTNPDKPSGRGRHTLPSPIKEAALAFGLPILQPESLRDPGFRSELLDLSPDIIVVVAFRILPEEVYTTARLGTFNLHASLLPKYRGAAPIQRAIMNGEKESGVTTFLLQKTVDTGGIILQARTPVGENETTGELYEKLSGIGAELVLHTVRLLEHGKANPRPQNESEATPAPKILKEHAMIRWELPSNAVHNHIRGLSPLPGASTTLKGIQVKMYRSRIVPSRGGSTAGEILEAGPSLIVGTGDGALEILELQQQGRKRLTAAEFLRGTPVMKGERFTAS